MPELSHQNDEQLELYALGRLPEPQAEAVEEHLLVCAGCQERLDEVEAFALAMRQALATETVAAERRDWLAWFIPPMFRPGMTTSGAFAGLAAVAGLVLAAFLLLHPGRTVAPLASLQLTATRGEVQSVVQAQETDITLTDAPAAGGLRAEVVDSEGAAIWSGAMSAEGKVKVVKQIAAGGYFVRLYDGAGKLLHEYGFRVRDAN